MDTVSGVVSKRWRAVQYRGIIYTHGQYKRWDKRLVAYMVVEYTVVKIARVIMEPYNQASG